MRRMILTVVTLALVLSGLVLSPGSGYADFYKWVDENGTVWLTDDPESLPEGSQEEFERVMVIEKGGETPPQGSTGLSEARESERRSSAESYLAKQERIGDEKKRLQEQISDIETDLATAQSALKRVVLTDRRGYWFIIGPAGKRVPATYRDPGAIWSTQTWPALPRSARTKESEERRKIEADITRLEAKLEEAKTALAQISRSP
jgi:hypothetical protein